MKEEKKEERGEKLKMKKIYLFFALFSVFILSGCTSDTDNRASGVSGQSFIGGFESLTFSFGENTPPDTVRDQGLQPFSIRLLVENKGEFDIPDGRAHVSLNGFNAQDLNLQNSSQTLSNLNGFRKQGTNTIPGGIQQVVFSDLTYVDSVVSGTFPLRIFANICYPYQTRAIVNLCINGNTVPSIDDRVRICDLNSQREVSNSGAPVYIENVRQYPSGTSSIQLQFDIVHRPTSNDANIYETNSFDSNCRLNGIPTSSSEALFKRDKVTYQVNTGIEGINCESTGSNSNTITLNSNKYTVTCIQDTTGQDEYETPISIVLDYDYLDRISKVITIEHVSR